MEQRAYDYILARDREAGGSDWVERLEATWVEHGTPQEYLRIRDDAMHELGERSTRSSTRPTA